MSQFCWSANPHGEYWIDVDLGTYLLQVLIDTGLIDARGQVGFSVNANLYDRFKLAGAFQQHQLHSRLAADGQISQTESGSITAQLVCPLTQTRVGPAVTVYVFRGALGVPDRVGLAFFHLLKGCKVHWDLDGREWCIDCP
jgi:hypothetical protein